MKKILLFSVLILASCSKDPIEITPLPVDPPVIAATTLSERFSDINETSGYFKAQEKFSEYLSQDYLWNTLTVPSDGHSSWHTWNKNSAILDFDGDGSQDIVAFATSFCSEHRYATHKGKYIIMLDYKNNSIPQIYESEHSFGSGKMEVNDFDNDGVSEVLFYSTETKMNMYSEEENVGGDTNYPPMAPTLLDYSSTLVARSVGVAVDSHTGASGDIDNDGDVDFIQWSVPSLLDGEEIIIPPTLQLNNGNATFSSAPLIVDLDIDDWYTTAIDLFDINNDGNLDLLVGWRIGAKLWYDVYPNYFNSLSGPVIMYGDGTGRFSKSSSIEIQESFLSSRNIAASLLSFGFTDYDKDGDIDIILTTTRDEPGGNNENGKYYKNFYLIFLENSNGSYVDRTEAVIQDSYNNDYTYTNFYFVRTVDINNDGHSDIVPDGWANWDPINYGTQLKWINVSGKFLRN